MKPSCADVGRLYPLIANASLDKPESFAKRVLEILCEVFSLKAASLYTISPSRDTLILRGQYGLRYDRYRSFTIPLATPAGDAITSGRLVSVRDIQSEHRYVDRALIRDFGLRGLVAAPLTGQAEGVAEHPDRFGVLCAYPKDLDHMEPLAEQLEEIAPFVGKLYLAALDHLKMRLRREFVAQVGYSHDLPSLLHRSVHFFREQLHVEAASVFIVDRRNGFLRMMGTTGLQGGLKKEQIFFPPASTDPTYRAFMEGTSFEGACSDLGFRDPLPEKCNSRPEYCKIFPFAEAAARKEQPLPPLGVIRAINPFLVHDGVRHPTVFGWEEAALVRFYTEMVAVLVHFMKKGIIAEYDFERSMHGAKNNLQAAISHLQLLEMYGKLQDHLPDALQFSLVDSISFLSDIRSQISRLELRTQKLDLQPIDLYGEVISKLPPIIHQSARASQVGPFKVTRLDEAGFNHLPKVLGNTTALFAVFRNLAENAVKYCRNDGTANKVDFSCDVLKDMVRVSVSDNGMGIPRGFAAMLFVEGSRTEDAIKRHPAGTGMGLVDCRELLQKMGGSIEFDSKVDLTTFHVLIPIARGEG